ncbi:LAFA_0E08614g1_1 [Lachancea sp. 'fantastica']|nr:LAFA_0E08614g1_1 [Lachancea sp. 'fantastica']
MIHGQYQEETNESDTKTRVQPRARRMSFGRKAGQRAAQKMNMALEDGDETADNSDFDTGSSPVKEERHVYRYGNEERAIDTQDNESPNPHFDKRKVKIAPRSTLQFKIGPKFEESASYCQIVCSATQVPVKFTLSPRIDRGFDQYDDQWIGYKRNYFTLVTSFEVVGVKSEEFLLKSYQATGILGSTKAIEVKYFAVRLVATCSEDDSPVTLVQHTAKRDKGPQFEPPILPLVPAPLPTHQVIREASNVRNEAKMKKYDHLFYLSRSPDRSSSSRKEVISTYPENRIRKVARYERVQFSSSINAKKSANQTKHFQLRVILGCVIDETRLHPQFFQKFEGKACFLDSNTCIFVPITEMISPPLVIRGRSPSNYYGANAEATEDNKTKFTTAPGPHHQNSKLGSSTATKPSFKFCGPVNSIQAHERMLSDITNRGDGAAPNSNFKSRLTCPSIARPRVKVDLQTMSCIEALMLERSASCMDDGALRKDLDKYPKILRDYGQNPPGIGMKDIELGPLVRLASSHSDHDLGFTHEAFHLGMGSLGPSSLPIQHGNTAEVPVEKKRKLHNKSSLNRANYSEDSANTEVGDLTETAYVEPYSPNEGGAAKRPKSLIVSRAGVRANPMDISFCLNFGTDQSACVLYRPNTSLKAPLSRHMLTSSAKPSEVFGTNESFDEPSFYKH